ncbi:Four and a half LIM domains protein 3 [Sarcoptes scabiei]|nr:Four and a half LIM domains protein 3 [Sarcoptes scabiei]
MSEKRESKKLFSLKKIKKKKMIIDGIETRAIPVKTSSPSSSPTASPVLSSQQQQPSHQPSSSPSSPLSSQALKNGQAKLIGENEMMMDHLNSIHHPPLSSSASESSPSAQPPSSSTPQSRSFIKTIMENIGGLVHGGGKSTKTNSYDPNKSSSTSNGSVTKMKISNGSAVLIQTIKSNSPIRNGGMRVRRTVNYSTFDHFDDEEVTGGGHTELLRKDPKYWHMEHFNCIYCQRSLQSDRYVLIDQSLLDPQRIKPPPPPPKPTKRNKNRGEKLKKIDQTNQQPQQQQQENVYQLDGQPCCVPCYEQNYANVCDECQKPIGVDSKDLSFNERHWHEGCFICCECKKDLYEKPFGFRADQIFCAHCYDRRFAPRCCKCDEQFVAGQRKLDYRGKQWHEHCFCCRKCLKPIGTRAFRAKKDDIYCNECYDEIFSTRCIKCSEIVTSNGVVFRDEPWHIECFKCNECNCELTSIPFLTRNDRPYCRGCHANLFAHRCQKCSKPITGTSGTKMITHETRHWHIACFRCYDCEKSLEGKGFIATDPDKDNMMAILCIDCASIRVADSMKKSEMMMMMDLNKESNTNTNNNNNKNNNNNNSASNRDINIDKNSTSKANTNTSTSNNNNNNSNNNNYDKNNNEDIYEKNSQKNTSDNTNRNDVNQIYNDDDDV